MPKILLFDIDGTLITSGGAGGVALEQAFVELTGIQRALKDVVLDGATDVAIVREALVLGGEEPTTELMERLLTRYTELLPSALAGAENFRILAGVEKILDALAAQGRHFGLCTGNVRDGARHKLTRGGVWKHFSGAYGAGFSGGFGDDGEIRADIVRAALRRAEAHVGRLLNPEEALVIGDTPRDVVAAHAAGVPVLAVASGRSSAEELRATGADHVVESLDSPEALAILELET